MFRFVFVAAVISISRCASSSEDNQHLTYDKKPYRATIRHIESGGIGYENGYTTLEAFVAADPGKWTVTPFLDARGHLFDDGRWAANAGIGLRARWENRAYGINTYYDFRNTNRLTSNQIGLGFESLGSFYDIRINGYLPVGGKTSAPYDTSFGNFEGHFLLISQKYQSAMRGANAELGFHFANTEWLDFYAAIGPYYFRGEVAQPTWGGKARILGTFKEILTLELTDSYDRTFHNKFQGQISLSFSFGSKAKTKDQGSACPLTHTLYNRMLQPVDRQEIIVIDRTKKKTAAIDPATGLPYYFVFIDNTGHSNGTYESPYHTFAQAQTNSYPNNILYVFPGDGTTRGMDSGITLKENQKLWGSGISHWLQTSLGAIYIPAQTTTFPTITNTNIHTDENAINLASNNAISGITITSAFNDAIYGVDVQSLDVSTCNFQNTTTYAIEATFAGDASISFTNNQFLNNVNGIHLNLNGASNLACSGNTFEGQTSISSAPLEIFANNNTLSAQIADNVFANNRTGSVRVILDTALQADINVLNNTFTNNGTGSEASLGSSLVLYSVGTSDDCSIVLDNNTFSGNSPSDPTLNSLYVHNSGAITNLSITATSNTISDNGGSALTVSIPVDSLTLLATDNTISRCGNNGIAIIAPGTTTTSTISIHNNTISQIGNSSNGIALDQNFANLDLTISNNVIDACDGSGILYFSLASTNITANIIENVFSNCLNMGSSNAGSAISLDTYSNLTSTIENNTFTNDASPSVTVGYYTSGNPTVCLTLTGNTSDIDPSYILTNPGSGAFNLSPCNVEEVNTGMIESMGSITPVQSCPEGVPCT